MRFMSYIIVLILGFLLSFAVSPSITGNVVSEFPNGENKDTSLLTPSNVLTERDVILYDNMVVLMVKDASISRYKDTGSMRPIIDTSANGIRIVPQDESEINVGDIVTYQDGARLIVHRVIEKGEDEDGIYFITSGDNSPDVDPKLRFSDIKYKTIAILY